MTAQQGVPQAFFWRRMHSLMGLWLVIFLIEHLLTNSQAALWISDDGSGFVRAVNAIQNLPYIHAIEVFLLGVPFLIHMAWGIKYLKTGQVNSFPSSGASPSLTKYPRNHAYTWQRITSWILLIAIIGHVAQMRFINYPTSAQVGSDHFYMTPLALDDGMYTLAPRLDVKLFDQEKIENEKQKLKELSYEGQNETIEKKLVREQRLIQKKQFIEALESKPLQAGQVMAVAPSFGTAELLVVRETFKLPLMLALYTIFVLSAVFHGFNGLWTFLVTWGVNLTDRSQALMYRVTTIIMLLIGFLGLAAIWGTYWITLKY